MIKDAGFELELASGEAVPADPAAVEKLVRPLGSHETIVPLRVIQRT
jgi:hypothetical protein